MSPVKTQVTESFALAADAIRNGGTVAFPTETVFGLGADALNKTAVAKIFEAKGRPADNPLIVHVANREQVSLVAQRTPEIAIALMEAFFPGPLTLVLPKHSSVPAITTAGLDSVAVRMPNHPVALRLIEACQTPLAAPSANRSGRPSPTTWEDVLQDLDGRIDVLLKGSQSLVGLESTVVDCTGETPVILRTGAISLEEIQQVAPTATYSRDNTDHHKSPGTRHRHYQPNAKVVLVDAPFEGVGGSTAFIGFSGGTNVQFRMIPLTVEEYAHHLYSFFRNCDRAGIGVIFCERVSEKGLGVALMDRLKRASGE